MIAYELTVVQLSKMLENLNRWLDKARAHAEAKGFDVDTLLTARLAPDQFALVRQIQSACDSSKFAAARLTGKQAPSHPDEETTVDQLQQRIRVVVEYLRTYQPSEFEGAEEREIALPFLDGKKMLGRDYLVEMQLPNVYFHVVTAYAILRHNGVDLTKRDFIGSLKLH